MLKWTKYGQDKRGNALGSIVNTEDHSETINPQYHTTTTNATITHYTEEHGLKDQLTTNTSTNNVSVNVSEKTSSNQIIPVLSQKPDTVLTSAIENLDNSNQRPATQTLTCEADQTNSQRSPPRPSAVTTSSPTSQETRCSDNATLSNLTQATRLTPPTTTASTSSLTPSGTTESLIHINTRRRLESATSENTSKEISHKELSEKSKMASALPDVTSLSSVDRQILGPEVAWEEEDLTLEQVADKDDFPCVCSFEEHAQEKNGQLDRLQPGLKIYSRQPVLMHMRVTKKQARARTIYKDPKGAYYEVGQTIIIPADYQGWFELVPSDFSRSTCFMSIAEVAKAMPRKFFTRSNVKGIRTEGEGVNQKFLERKIPAGSVLETRGTFAAKWKTVAETGLLKKKTKEWELQEVTYLKCLDRDQTEILVPLTHKGKFNAIYEKGQLTQNAVYSVKDILTDLSLPIKVRLLFGKAPVVPCIFTGMLVIRNATTEDSIVGSTVLNTRNVLFEIPVSAPVKVKYISTDEHFQEMSTYRDAQKLCKKYANVFSTMIKLAPDLDTDQKVIMHVPTDASLMRQVDETLRALDLITDISFAGEPKDYLLDSDAGSVASEDQVVVPPSGPDTELTEFKSRESQTFV